MIDHITLHITDLERAKAFYTAALAPLGYELLMNFPGFCGFGVKPSIRVSADFWIAPGGAGLSGHVAFRAATRSLVDAFYAAAIAAGGKDNGPPGPRFYHPHYYGGFVLDPDGNNIEAVCHEPYLA